MFHPPQVFLIAFLCLFSWAVVIVGGWLGFSFATLTLHLTSFWLIAPITLAYALAALLLLPLSLAIVFPREELLKAR